MYRTLFCRCRTLENALHESDIFLNGRTEARFKSAKALRERGARTPGDGALVVEVAALLLEKQVVRGDGSLAAHLLES